LLCLAIRGFQQLRGLGICAEPISLDSQSQTGSAFRIILDVLSKLLGLVEQGWGDVIGLLRLGLSGLVQASANLDADLASAVTAIQAGCIWVPESALLEHARRVQSLIDGQLAPHTVLSAREAQVLDSVTWGRSNKEIAGILVITERTVKFHVSNILSKLGLERRTELVRWHGTI
ncbi:MAG TPA: LuxR C-terminal-related transcriptional regulator, partial [Bryobacteraceae bacterium]|nr:LuxR C-terminal-related transcriptional regulator [Bryobacteraceae bacterium]